VQWTLWLIFANNSGFREMLAGAGAAMVSSLLVSRFLVCTDKRYTLERRYLAQAIHIPEILISGTLILLRVIAIRLMGKKVPAGIVAVHFRTGRDDRRTRGRRALAITFLTFAPNNLVFDILLDQQILFFHTVIPQPLPHFMLHMGAEPGHDQ
jgi:multisubunit Na+/H+ antiporter MnhE subunit